MPTLTVGETDIRYRLRRSEVATKARIVVTPEMVQVVVPSSALHRRRGWLVQQTRKMAERVARAPTVGRFRTGAKVPFRGRLMRLTVEPTESSLVEVTYRNGFVVGCPRNLSDQSRDPLIESALRLWLRKRLWEDVTALVRQHGVPNGLRPKAVRIKDQKHLWGSCGRDRVVNLNWHLIFAPKTVLEYAVVHELCHLRHRNHDDPFWTLIGTILPDWERRKSWLDENEHWLGVRQFDFARPCTIGIE
jgi:predicted metal-dependent hydrolase